MGRRKGGKNGMQTQVWHTCEECGVEFARYPSRLGKYCSRLCGNRAKARINAARLGPENPHFKKGTTTYRRYALARKGQICADCGAKLPSEMLSVHHEDQDPLNQDISNLTVLCEACHRARHQQGCGQVRKQCPICGDIFEAHPHEAETRLYCSRKCAQASPEYRDKIRARRKTYFARLKETTEGRAILRERMTRVSHARANVGPAQ